MNPEQNQPNVKYKTMLCRHYGSPQGCSYGAKCQFAHGQEELKPFEGQILPQKTQQNQQNQKQKNRNPLNYKIAKCKNFEKEGKCRYGDKCTFAHGDSELRQKSDNMMLGQQMNMMMYNPMMMNMDTMGMPMNMMGMPMGFTMPGQIPNIGMEQNSQTPNANNKN